MYVQTVAHTEIILRIFLILEVEVPTCLASARREYKSDRRLWYVGTISTSDKNVTSYEAF